MKIWTYIARRLFYTIPILLGVCLVVFLLFNVVGGDPAITLLGKHASTEQIREVRDQLGLNKSLPLQYLDIVKSAFTMDFGRSWATKQDIWTMFKQGAPASLSFSLPGFIFSTIISILISLFVSFYRGSKLDRYMVIGCVALMSTSSLAIILFGQWFFAFHLGWFEISGYEFGLVECIPYVLLPILIWTVLNIGPNVRFFRTVVLDEVYQDYVRTARAKGLTEKTILFKHILKNAMIPIITFTVIQIPFLILGALLIENFFSIPGLGGITLNAINNSDFPVIKAVTILSSMGYIIFSVLTDVLYVVFDPRVKLS